MIVLELLRIEEIDRRYENKQELIMGKKIFLTGATCYIGKRILPVLVELLYCIKVSRINREIVLVMCTALSLIYI